MSENLIALMIANLWFCGEGAGAQLRPQLGHRGENTDFSEIGYRHEARQGGRPLPATASPAADLAPVPTSSRAD